MSFLTSSWAPALRRHWRLAGALLAFLVLVGATGAYLAWSYNQPTVATFNIRQGATEVPLDQELVIGLSRPADAAQVAAHFTLTPGASLAFGHSRDGLSFTWTPVDGLAELTTYSVRLTAFKDSGGHRVNAAGWHFMTTIVPRVTSLRLAGGASVADGAQLALKPALTLVFNDPMNTASVRLLDGSAEVPLTWDSTAEQASFQLTDPPGIAALSLAPGGRDSKGRPMAAWHLTLNLVFEVDEPTTALAYPAIVQVPNDPTARDQSGLQAADIVFEYITEGGIRRLSALFTHVPKTVGPIRSGRLISFKLTRHYHSLLFFSGLSDGSTRVLESDPVPTFGDTLGYDYRSSDRYPPNNLFLSGDAIGRAERLMGLAPYSLPATGVPATSGWNAAAAFQVAEHDSKYQYDPATDTYLKFEDDFSRPMYDALIAQPLHAQMVIVMHTAETPTPFVEDVTGAHGTDFDMQSGGAAEIYYRGLVTEGRWAGSDRSAPLVFKDAAGNVVPLPQGLVWVDVVR